MIREIDKLGRLVIPKEMRDIYHLAEKVEIVATDEGVLIRNPVYKVVQIDEMNNEFQK